MKAEEDVRDAIHQAERSYRETIDEAWRVFRREAGRGIYRGTPEAMAAMKRYLIVKRAAQQTLDRAFAEARAVQR